MTSNRFPGLGLVPTTGIAAYSAFLRPWLALRVFWARSGAMVTFCDCNMSRLCWSCGFYLSARRLSSKCFSDIGF